MLICNKCGSEINENNLFCSHCGAKITVGAAISSADVAGDHAKSAAEPEFVKFCGKCGARLPQNCIYCLICGTKAGEAPPLEQDAEPEDKPVPVPSKAPVSTLEPTSQRHSKRLIAVCVFLCVLLVTCAASLWFAQSLPYFGSARTARAKAAILYATADNRLKFKTQSMDAAEEIVSNFQAETGVFGAHIAKSSANGRYIAYLNGYLPDNGKSSGQLFLRDFGNKPMLDAKEQSDLLIAENVLDGFFFVDGSNSLIFLTANGELCITNFTENKSLDSGVDEIIDHNESYLLYAKASGEKRSVYLCPTTDGHGDKIMIDSDILELSDYTPTFQKFVYLRAQANGSRDVVTFDAENNNRRTLAEGVDGIIAADARVFTVLFQMQGANSLSYEDLIYDEFAASDELIDEPDMENYPLLKEYYEKHGVDEGYEGSMDSEEIVEESGQLQIALEEYEQRRERDKLRQSIHSDIDDFLEDNPVLYELHLNRDGAEVRLAEGSYRPFTDAGLDIDKGFAVWTSTYLENIGQIEISQYSQVMQDNKMIDYLQKKLSQSLNFQQFGYASATLYIGEGQFYSGGWQIAEKGDGIYFAMGESNPLLELPDSACGLYFTQIQNGSAGKIILVDENVAAVGGMLNGQGLLYYKGLPDTGELFGLYLMNGTAGRQIGYSVCPLNDYTKIENNGKTLLYRQYVDMSNESGSLFVFAKQNRQIATDVYRVFYRNDSLIYFLQGFKEGKAGLYSFGNDGLVLVDENVTAVYE